MPSIVGTGPGFLAYSAVDPSRRTSPQTVVQALGVVGPTVITTKHVDLIVWGLKLEEQSTLLCLGARKEDREIDGREAGRLILNAPERLCEVVAPFAALTLSEEELVVATDLIGARHVYWRVSGDASAVSTSLAALTSLERGRLDQEAIGVQSLLGWQVGSRTWLDGVQKLDAASLLRLRRGRIELECYDNRNASRPIALEAAVLGAATLLRGYLDAYLNDHPDGTLQLTGGQDSRLLLSAIPVARRRGLRAMTLRVPGSEDVAIASELARRVGLRHQVVDLDGIAELDPEEVIRRCIVAAQRLNYMADPLALVAVGFAESQVEQGARLSGLGGEVARGFYYVGPTFPLPTARPLATALAKWRLFANEAVPSDVLEPAFAHWARDFTLREVSTILARSSDKWWPATDEFYLYQRMQRWSGVTDSAVCFDRAMVNPMLDHRFLDIARGLRPHDKRGSRFLARLQIALDPELARVRLEGRPPPEAFARGGLGAVTTTVGLTTRKGARKVRQRLLHTHKPPAGGDLLAAKVVEHWRDRPDAIQALGQTEIVRQEWVEQMLAGAVDPEPAALAFLINLIAASEDLIPR